MLAAVCCFFNPCNYDSIKRNYFEFRKNLKGADLFTIELSFDANFVIDDALHIRGTKQNLMWQKERLLNLLVESLPAKYDAIAWIDADIIFENDNWAADAETMLERYPVVQLFESVNLLNSAGAVQSSCPGQIALIKKNLKSSMYKPGYAWAAKREIFPLLDLPLVTADALMLHAWQGSWQPATCLSQPVKEAYLTWAANQYRSVKGQVGFLPDTISHLWHGKRENRQYTESQIVLDAAGFDPAADLTKADNGLWCWSSNKPQMHKAVADYFDSRNDDEPSGKIKVGFVMPTCAMGGVTRYMLTLMQSPIKHNIEWSGIAVLNNHVFDADTAAQLIRHCPMYCPQHHDNHQGYVITDPDAFQRVVDESDIVNVWGFVWQFPELEKTNFNKPILTVSHGQNNWTKRSLELCCSLSDKIIPCSVSYGGVACYPENIREKVKVIYNSVDFNRCAPSMTKAEALEKYNLPKNKKLVGYCGRMTFDKNPMATAHAAQVKNCHAVFIGEGAQLQPVLAEIKKICGDNFTYIPRVEDIGTIYHTLDCLVAAGPSEGGPLTVMEAWACGLPVVSTPVGVIPELQSKYGKLVFHIPIDPNPAQIQKAVKQALRTNKKLIDRAKQVAWCELSPMRMMKKYEEMLCSSITI